MGIFMDVHMPAAPATDECDIIDLEFAMHMTLSTWTASEPDIRSFGEGRNPLRDRFHQHPSSHVWWTACQQKLGSLRRFRNMYSKSFEHRCILLFKPLPGDGESMQLRCFLENCCLFIRPIMNVPSQSESLESIVDGLHLSVDQVLLHDEGQHGPRPVGLLESLREANYLPPLYAASLR